MRMSRVFFFGSLLILVLTATGISFFAIRSQSEEKLPLSILNNCFPNTSVAGSGPDDACLKKSIDSLLLSRETTDLMDYIVASTTPRVVTNACHSAAHIIGETTFIKFGNVETALNECSRGCNDGCIHGVIAAGIARELGSQYLNEDIVHANPAKVEAFGAKYCSEKLQLGLCHAMGHILYIGSQDIKEALHGCEKIGSEAAARENCAPGVFMEASGILSFVKSTTTSDRKNDDYAYPCNVVASQYRHACFLYLPNFQYRLFIENNIPDAAQFAILRRVCESFEDKKTRSDCFLGVGNTFLNASDNNDDPEKHSASLCETLSGTDQDSCIVGFALKIAFHNRYADAFNYCSRRSSEQRTALCYNVIFQTMGLASFTEKDVHAYCASSNDTDLCRRQYVSYNLVARSLPRYYLRGLF